MNHEGGKAEESGDIPTCVDYDFLEGEDNYTEVNIFNLNSMKICNFLY